LDHHTLSSAGSVPDTFRKGGKSGALGENNVTKRELCNENCSFLSILVAKLLLCNTIFQEALLLIHAILPSFKKCPVLNPPEDKSTGAIMEAS